MNTKNMNTMINSPSLWQAELPVYKTDDHKYRRGLCLVFCGAMSGAAQLSASSALRCGAGYVRLVSLEKITHVRHLPLAISVDENLSLRLVEDFLASHKVKSMVIGPGLGFSKEKKDLLWLCLQSQIPIVCDADALKMIFSDLPSYKHELHDNCIYTPHAGEYHDCFGDRSGEDVMDKLPGVLIKKGPRTKIFSRGQNPIENHNAPPYLATAGSGDVLSGLLGGLLAQSVTPYTASCQAVWLHGEAANQIGRGCIADDLITKIPKVINQLVS